MLGVGERIAHQLGHGVEQAESDSVAMLGRCGLSVAGIEQRQNRQRRIQSSADVRHRWTWFRGRARTAGDSAGARLRLHEQVVSPLVRQRSAGTVSVDLYR